MRVPVRSNLAIKYKAINENGITVFGFMLLTANGEIDTSNSILPEIRCYKVQSV